MCNFGAQSLHINTVEAGVSDPAGVKPDPESTME